MDWKQLILEIQATGLSQAQIGEIIGKSQAWVSATSKGVYNDVRWADGQALIDLHGARCFVTDKAA
jgi:hypothetical protein